MKCPVCKCRDLRVGKATGYASDFVKECMDCNCVWIFTQKSGVEIIDYGKVKKL